MKHQKARNRTALHHLWLNILFLLFFAALTIFSLYTMREKLLQNAQQFGTSLTQNYAAEEQNNIDTYSAMMNLGTQYLDQMTENDASEQQIQTWIENFFRKMPQVLQDNSVDLYAIVEGHIVAANPWDGDDSYDFRQTDWYRMAMEANGEVIFTSAYQDAITGKQVITIAQKARNSDNMLLFDVFPEDFHTADDMLSLPEGSSYYLCDQEGTLLYAHEAVPHEAEQLQPYVNSLVQRIQEGVLDPYNASITGPDGKPSGVYYYQMSNGWITILTIPFRTVLRELTGIYRLFLFISSLFLIAAVLLSIRDYRLNRKIRRTDDTVRALGNLYYAIYRVNYKTGMYQAIKCAKDTRHKISATGRYADLLHTIQQVVTHSTYEEFASSFSLENIQQLVHDQVTEFGGDYLRRFENGERWVNVSILFDKAFAQDEVVLAFREVNQEKTRQLKQLELLQNALESSHRSEADKNAFFSNMSHDMRTPLNAIIGLSELAQHNLDDQNKLKTLLHKIQFSGQQLLNLVNDVLEISRMEQGHISLDYHPIDLQQCVDDCVETFRHQAKNEEKNLSLTCDLRHRMVLGDASRISQILNNLLSNAFKYSESGASISVRLTENITDKHSSYELSVQDTGIGMSQEFLQHVFEPYARETRFSARSIVGTGLGMAIVHSLVKRMDGEIRVTSELGQGSTFIVTLPLQIVTEPESTTTSLATEQTAQTEPSAFDLRGKKLLIAEDNEINMEIATEILSMHDVQVVQAWDGQQAVERFSASQLHEFDAILMDMQMPNINGCQAAQAIRMLDREDATTIPIIAVTANAFPEDIAKTQAAGMNAHIVKPIDFSVLCQLLQSLT
ncbi:ATP-binding protein [uncultured Agathobaculum sp.]|uniref:hybrid sensor histidine kinase/response regulator n=1 Tax=uncultured Agathobaculum sp. TaxID=2048140 RepID=UPI00320A0BAF